MAEARMVVATNEANGKSPAPRIVAVARGMTTNPVIGANPVSDSWHRKSLLTCRAPQPPARANEAFVIATWCLC